VIHKADHRLAGSYRWEPRNRFRPRQICNKKIQWRLTHQHSFFSLSILLSLSIARFQSAITYPFVHSPRVNSSPRNYLSLPRCRRPPPRCSSPYISTNLFLCLSRFRQPAEAVLAVLVQAASSCSCHNRYGCLRLVGEGVPAGGGG
jgi:hypothetical protein